MINMISLTNILDYYPPKLHNFPKWVLREYLQYLILKTIFSNEYSQKLCFIWGTSLRLWYDSQRFSEDLDFDNWWLTESEFENITEDVKNMLIGEWFDVKIRHIYKWAFHCEIKIPGLLYDNKLGSMPTENLTIKIDTVAQWFSYTPKKLVFQKFWLIFPVNIADETTLLTMKFNAFFSRVKWRDIFDIVYLLWKTQTIDFWILKETHNISNYNQLKERIEIRLDELDLVQLQKDVQPFLFDSNDQSVILFPGIIKNYF